MFRFAFWTLRNSGWAAWPTDKDGGYAVLPRESIPGIYLSILQSDAYVEIPMRETQWDLMAAPMQGAIRAILKADAGRVTRSQLMGSCFVGATWVSRLKCTVKTHKQEGNVSCRAIHTTSSYIFTSIARWVSAVLREGMAPYVHLLQDTRALIKFMSGQTFTHKTWFVKGDVKDFFMTGDVDTLMSGAIRFTPVHLKEAMQVALRFLLYAQFIEAPGITDRVWRTRVGSGMGLPHSSEVADAAMLCREVDGLLRHFHEYDVVAYARYRDDLLIAINAHESNVPHCWHAFKRWAHPFEVTLDGASDLSVVMLDVEFYKGDGWSSTGVIDYRPYVKPTSQGLVLNHTSDHTPSIHLNWPMGEVKRFWRNSSSVQSFLHVRDRLVMRLKRYNHPKNVIEAVKSFNPISRLQFTRATSTLLAQAADAKRREPEKVWLVLPYHDVWLHGGVAGLIRSLNEDCLMQELLAALEVHFKVGVAWKLASKPIQHDIVSIS